MVKRRLKKETLLHFVGIGGIGMSGIAEVFLNQGYLVSGSDLAESDTTRRLASLGAHIVTGHDSAHVTGVHVVVISSAVRANNPEVVEAKRLRIPVIPRAEMLAELMRGRTGVAVAGTHGKTSTTSMIATILTFAGLDPTLVIGGKVDSLGGNAKLGQGQYIVAEADESDGSFLQLPASYGVVTNIDNDHLDFYQTLSAIEDAFTYFVGKLPFYGVAVVCGDDPGVRRCLDRFTKPFVTYGFSDEWDYSASDLRAEGVSTRFTVSFRKEKVGEAVVHVPGRHNVLNALASIAIGLALEIPFDLVVAGLGQYRGVGRRFDIKWSDESRRIAVVDDYAHHPTEIAATLQAARAFWGTGRIVTAFQPHRYTRTQHCFDAFMSVFKDTDLLLMTDIYSAGEEAIAGIDSPTLVREISARGTQAEYAGDLASTRAALLHQVREGDLVLCLGAGSITHLARQLGEELALRYGPGA